jgi:TRAP-type transport system periplasmic protein
MRLAREHNIAEGCILAAHLERRAAETAGRANEIHKTGRMIMSKTTGPSLTRRGVLAAGMAALAVTYAAHVQAADPKVLRISTPGTQEEWQSKALEVFKTELEKLAPGQFDVQLHFNGTLFAQGTEIEAMQRGNLEVALVSPQDIANFIPEYSIFTNGYLIRDPAHLDAVYDGEIGKEYAAKVSEVVGLHIVRSQYLGTRHVILREPREVKTTADLAGVKLRMPGSDTWQFMGGALGANATPLAFEEVYLAMQTGTVDGLENPLPDAMAAKFYEVSKQVVLTGHMVANIFFAVANDFWNSLTDEQKAAIEAAEAKAKAFNDAGVIATEAEASAFFESKGVKVTTPDVAAFRDHVQKAFLESPFAEKWPAGMLDRINAAGS